MKKLFIIISLFLLTGSLLMKSEAQVASASDNLVVLPVCDRTVNFSLSDTGVFKPITWGLDLAWSSEENLRRGVAFMGQDNVDVVRSSFTPTDSLINGDLAPDELATLNRRLTIINKWLGNNTQVALNCDHPTVHAWYIGQAAHWAQLIDVTTRRHQEAGRTVVSVSPFNEPDYGWGQYAGQNGQSDFYNIATELRKNDRFDNIRICGGNTLNCDQALPWYNYLKNILDEGNTHQLAGSFDNYAAFHEAVRANGDHSTNDELHNVMEAMVGVEYGLQTGIWWGTAELARGEFVKASDGKRLAYAEHRANWTAASVYRSPEGKVQAFGGTSERQAATTSYLFISKDRDVYFDGYGPQRGYVMNLPGGIGYQDGQSNAEKVVNITWGDDIQPVIKGRYVVVNRNSGLVIEVTGGSTSAGANIRQATYAQSGFQQWNITPVDEKVGGDFSYFTFSAFHSGKVIDIYNWSLENGGNLVVWDYAKNLNQQWFLEYAGDGWFYIRSRYSAKCIEVANASTANGAKIQQMDCTGGSNQQWRFLPVDAKMEFDAPAAPANLRATANVESILLAWEPNTENDITSYTIFRADSATGSFNTIARNIKATSFVDNTTTVGGTYFYKIKAKDYSQNSSAFSDVTEATNKNEKAIVVHLQFDGNTKDSSINRNHSAMLGDITYTEGKVGTQALVLNGTNSMLQLPAAIAHQQEITIATWVYWKGGANWQRIFDFGDGGDQFMYLTPKTRFCAKYKGTEWRIEADGLPVETWTHVAITFGNSVVRIYINGELATEKTGISFSPFDIKTVLNYIGRGQTTNPYFNGYIDDFIVFNYALEGDEISKVFTSGVLSINEIQKDRNLDQNFAFWPNPVNDKIYFDFSGNTDEPLNIIVYNMEGILVKSNQVHRVHNAELSVMDLPSGIYLIKLSNSKETKVHKILIKHK